MTLCFHTPTHSLATAFFVTPFNSMDYALFEEIPGVGVGLSPAFDPPLKTKGLAESYFAGADAVANPSACITASCNAGRTSAIL
jgi:hypothetical protein